MDYNLIENNSIKYHNESQWKSNNYGEFKIIGKTDIYKSRIRKGKSEGEYPYYLCEFSDGSKVVAHYKHIREGAVKNPNKINVGNIGFIGQGKYTWKNNPKEYRLWSSILKRCYHTEATSYESYGEKGVRVEDSWHNFQNFCEDLPLLHGYTSWIEFQNYELDKDMLCDGLQISPKIYSKNTCKFISKKDNISYSNLTGHTYIAIRISDGYKEDFTNQTDFSKKWGLIRGNIWDCLNGRQHKHKGWKFQVK
jgi:hypothetical protein